MGVTLGTALCQQCPQCWDSPEHNEIYQRRNISRAGERQQEAG